MNRIFPLVLRFVLLGMLGPNAMHVEALQGKILVPTADADVWSEEADWNRGRVMDLDVVRLGISSERLAFLMFDLWEIPIGSNISEAKLQMYAGAVDIKALVSAHYCASNDWAEDEITYNNKPSFSAMATDALNVTRALTWYEWNVTEAARTALSAADKKLSLVLKADTQGGIVFRSKDDPWALPQGGVPDTRPHLNVLYVAPPPSGNDPTFTILILIIAAGIAGVVLGITYKRLKHRKLKDKHDLKRQSVTGNSFRHCSVHVC